MWLDASVFAKAVHDAGAPLDSCWGFIDGTARPIARPIRNQRIMYSGHKRIHCIKFQVHEIHHMIFMRDFVSFPAVCHSTKWSHSQHVWSDCWPET